MEINEIKKKIHQCALEKGWWDVYPSERSIGDQFSNFHSEISEAWEEWRNGRRMDEIYFSAKNGKKKPEGVPIELADCIIRILDTCDACGIDIAKAIEIKMEYNQTREYRHGGKKA